MATDWGKLFELVTPVAVGATLDGPQRSGFMVGYQRGLERKRLQKEAEALKQQQRSDLGNKVMFELVEKLQEADDPVAFQQLQSAAEPWVSGLGVDTTPLREQKFNTTKQTAKFIQQIQTTLEAMDKNGMEPYAAENANNFLHVAGRADPIRLSDAVRMTSHITDPVTGKPIGQKAKVELGQTADERALARWAHDVEGVPYGTPLTWEQHKRGTAELLTLKPQDAAKGETRSVSVQAADAFLRGDMETYKKLLQVQKEVGLSDDRPLREPTLIGGRSPVEVATFNQIARDASRSPLIRAYDRTIVLDNAIKMVEQNPTDSTAQFQLAYAYIQALDTYQSAVREGELQNLGMLGTRLQGWLTDVNRIYSNGAFVAPQVAKQIAQSAKELSSTIEQGATSKRREYASQARVAGVGDMWDAYVAGFGGAPAKSGGAGTGTKVGRFTIETGP